MMTLPSALAMPIVVMAAPVSVPFMPAFAAEAKAERRTGVAVGRIGSVSIGSVIRA
jgi:hypothetical protein